MLLKHPFTVNLENLQLWIKWISILLPLSFENFLQSCQDHLSSFRFSGGALYQYQALQIKKTCLKLFHKVKRMSSVFTKNISLGKS